MCFATGSRLMGLTPCPLCSESHMYRQCPIFRDRKDATSLAMYHERRPRSAEEAGFCSAGILLHDVEFDRFLMINETRGSVQRCNFIGGKRECRLGWFGCNRLETSFETAITEFEEEMGVKIPTRRFSSVFWFPQSKFLLFVVSGTITVPIAGAEWLNRQEIECGLLADKFHGYIRSQLQMVMSCI